MGSGGWGDPVHGNEYYALCNALSYAEIIAFPGVLDLRALKYSRMLSLCVSILCLLVWNILH